MAAVQGCCFSGFSALDVVIFLILWRLLTKENCFKAKHITSCWGVVLVGCGAGFCLLV